MIFLADLLGQVGWQPVLAVLYGNSWLPAEPSPGAPALQIKLASAAEIFLVEELLHLAVPFGEMVGFLGGAQRRGEHGKLPDVDSVEVLQTRTPREGSSEVDDAETDSVQPPVVHLASLVGATVLLGSLSHRHLHGDLSEVLHGEHQTEDGENY